MEVKLVLTRLDSFHILSNIISLNFYIYSKQI